MLVALYTMLLTLALETSLFEYSNFVPQVRVWHDDRTPVDQPPEEGMAPSPQYLDDSPAHPTQHCIGSFNHIYYDSLSSTRAINTSNHCRILSSILHSNFGFPIVDPERFPRLGRFVEQQPVYLF